MSRDMLCMIQIGWSKLILGCGWEAGVYCQNSHSRAERTAGPWIAVHARGVTAMLQLLTWLWAACNMQVFCWR